MSEILFCEDIFREAISAAKNSAFVIADGAVCDLYGIDFADYKVDRPERAKTPQTVVDIAEAMQKKHVRRGDTVCVIGGGATGDIGGLAAALYMRGVKWINVPTTLLAMADAAIGGKTAVNLNGIKNVLGAFHPPEKIIISLGFTATLDGKQWLNGVGEIVKTCLLTERAYGALKAGYGGLIGRDIAVTGALVGECVRIKRYVTQTDPMENSLRRILNVGHTVAHALETQEGTHGLCVLEGIIIEALMFADAVDGTFLRELKKMIIPLVDIPSMAAEQLTSRALLDKKNADGITVMLPTSAGRVCEITVSEREFGERYIAATKALGR